MGKEAKNKKNKNSSDEEIDEDDVEPFYAQFLSEEKDENKLGKKICECF